MEIYSYKVYDTTYHVWLRKEQYENGRVALVLEDERGVVATATVNMPDVFLEPGEILIKTWSENEHMLRFLMTNKIVSDTGKDLPVSKYSVARVCRLLK